MLELIKYTQKFIKIISPLQFGSSNTPNTKNSSKCYHINKNTTRLLSRVFPPKIAVFSNTVQTFGAVSGIKGVTRSELISLSYY